MMANAAAAASKHSSTYAGRPSGPPPPDRPLPDRPPPKRRHTRRGRRDTRHRTESTASRPSSAASSASTTSTSFLTTTDNHHHSAPAPIMLPRPDSTILPLSPRLQRPLALDRRDFHALVRRGDVVQYWLTVEVVLRGLPGQGALPRGHWEKLVTMARDVVMGRHCAKRQLVTGWCHVDEPLGEA